MEKQIEVIIKEEKGRVDKVLAERLPNHSRSQIQQWLKEDAVTLKGETVRANYKVKAGDHLIIQVPEPEVVDLQPENIPLTIVYQDADVAVINKPQGMVVHPSAGHPNGTLVNALLYHMDDLSTINDVVRPGIVHRIDKDTSGLLMIAKNDQAHESLAKQLKDKTSLRKYVALVHGTISHEKGTINAPNRSLKSQSQNASRDRKWQTRCHSLHRVGALRAVHLSRTTAGNRKNPSNKSPHAVHRFSASWRSVIWT